MGHSKTSDEEILELTGSTATYWCLKTMGKAGPDQHFVHRSVCQEGRIVLGAVRLLGPLLFTPETRSSEPVFVELGRVGIYQAGTPLAGRVSQCQDGISTVSGYRCLQLYALRIHWKECRPVRLFSRG